MIAADSPLISVITVTRNAADRIASAIDSVLAQDYGNLEYLIIDGASTDGTLDVVRSYGNRISKVISERDDGIYFAMNKGLLTSSGSAILFINSDDRLSDSAAISSLIGARLRYSSADPALCYTDFIKYYPSIDKSLLVVADEEFEKGFALCHQAMLVDRIAYDRVGLFDTSFRYAADHDWAVRAKNAGVRFIRGGPTPAVVFRHGGATHVSYKASRTEGGRIIYRYFGRVAYSRYTVRQFWVRILRAVAASLGRIVGARASASIQGGYFRLVRGYRPIDRKTSE